MQVNRIQFNNYNTSFGRLGRYGGSSSSASEVKNVIDSFSRGGRHDSSAKDLVEKLIDKCDNSELKEIAEKLNKKLKTPNVDNTWF